MSLQTGLGASVPRHGNRTKTCMRIRNFGFLANRKRATLLPLCFQLHPPQLPPQRPPSNGFIKRARNFSFRSTLPLQAVAILPLGDFHEVSVRR